MHRVMVPFVQSLSLYGLKPRFGIERIKALPMLLCSAEALMRLVGFNAQQVRQGVCQRGVTKRQGERPPGPMCPDTLAQQLVKGNVRDLEAVCNGVIRALATAGGFGKRVAGIADGTDLETTARSAGGGQATRKRRLQDTWGEGHAIAGTVDGWKVRLLLDAVTKIPLAVKVVQLPVHEALWTRALVPQARANLAGCARRPKGVLDQACLAGTALWWLDQHGSLLVGPAQDNLAVTAEARALAAAGEGVTVGRRVHTVRQGQGKTAGSERLETAVGGSTGVDDGRAVWDHGTWARSQAPRLRAEPEQRGGGPHVDQSGRWARGHNGLLDQGLGAAALAAV
jgi:hypothetical protein